MTETLKAATRQLHEQIEAENPARYIVDHTIDLETYRLLLLQNYLAYKHTELAIGNVLEKYEGKKFKQLEKDLENLGVPVMDMPLEFTCRNIAEALGAAYVVEGSALGGMVLAKHLPKCAALSGIQQHHFFNGNRENMKEWNSFKKSLSEYPFSEEEEIEAIEKAKETFEFFGRIFRMDLSGKDL